MGWKSRLVLGSASLVCHVMLPYGSTIPDGHNGLFRNDLLDMTIVDGARPGNRRMIAGLQPPMAEMTGSRHIRSTFHPASRWLVSMCDFRWPIFD